MKLYLRIPQSRLSFINNNLIPTREYRAKGHFQLTEVVIKTCVPKGSSKYQKKSPSDSMTQQGNQQA
ncbi:hypothetical protein CPL00371_CDS0003 [Klebsiella phage MegaDucksbill]|uniref:Uncharacterized protein n=4 Tax=Teetrevirus TaxID=2732693 RepID=A0AAE7XH53_9CAUD|nr:hypothetical protein [Klebsiella phage vB_KpnP-VAC1]UNA05088.1 hypothetical protein [Pantoea phage vB_PdeP_F1M1C]